LVDSFEFVKMHGPTNPKLVKPDVATAVVELLMMGVRMPETC
jgi:hypothetical protein